jgi:molybdopterin synthase catalytic subunit
VVVDVIEIRREEFSVDEVVESLLTEGMGAVVTFVGVVRDSSKGRLVEHIEIEVYKEMAYKQLEAIRDEAIENFGVEEVSVIHRYGTLKVSESIMMIAVGAAHRGEAFDACRYVINNIKKRVPIWKKEVTPDGESWVEGEIP